MKKIKVITLLSIVSTIFPIPIGLILWEKLPSKIPTHFNKNYAPDGWSTKTSVVFELPLILLFFQLALLFFIISNSQDINKEVENSGKYLLVVWIFPILSLLVNGFFLFKSFL